MKLTRQQRKLKAKKLEHTRATLSAHTSTIYRALDHKIHLHIDDDPELKADISCRRGCAACCTQIVKMTIPEATLIVHTQKEAVERALPELERQAAVMDELGVIEGKVEIDKMTANELSDHEKKAQKWFVTRTYCAFLDQSTMECTIYDARPVVCRSYFVVKKGPEICAEIPMPGETDFAVPGWEPPEAQIAIVGLVDMQMKIMKNGAILPIPQAILHAMKGKWVTR